MDIVAEGVLVAAAEAEGEVVAADVAVATGGVAEAVAATVAGTIIKTEATTGGFIGVLSLFTICTDRIWAPGMTPVQV